MMTFLLFAPASAKGLGWRKDRKCRRDRSGRFCDIYCADTLLRYAVTFCGAVVLKVMDQKTLVKSRWSYKVRITAFIYFTDSLYHLFSTNNGTWLRLFRNNVFQSAFMAWYKGPLPMQELLHIWKWDCTPYRGLTSLNVNNNNNNNKNKDSTKKLYSFGAVLCDRCHCAYTSSLARLHEVDILCCVYKAK